MMMKPLDLFLNLFPGLSRGLFWGLSLGLLCSSPAFADIWIDVRTAEEYRQGHVKSAINIPHDQMTTEIEKLGLDKTTRIRLYCVSGGRAERAKDVLHKLGYKRAMNAGAYDDIKVN